MAWSVIHRNHSRCHHNTEMWIALKTSVHCLQREGSWDVGTCISWDGSYSKWLISAGKELLVFLPALSSDHWLSEGALDCSVKQVSWGHEGCKAGWSIYKHLQSQTLVTCPLQLSPVPAGVGAPSRLFSVCLTTFCSIMSICLHLNAVVVLRLTLAMKVEG